MTDIRNIPRQRQPGDRLFEHTTKGGTMRKRTITRSRGERGFAALFAAIIVIWLAYVALITGVIVIAIHFILKFW